MLPAVGLLVDLLPFEPDDVDEEALGQAVAAHDGDGNLASLRSEAEGAIVEQLGVAVLDEAVDGLGDRRSRQAESLDQAGANRDDAFFLDFEDGLEILLGCVVVLGHARSLHASAALASAGPPYLRGRFFRPGLRERAFLDFSRR